MSTVTAPFSASILYRDMQKTVDLLEAAAKEWAKRAQRNERLTEQSASLLAQMVRICLRSPGMVRDLWEWARAEEQAGRVRDRQRAGDYFRERLGGWLSLVTLLQSAAKGCEAEGHPISGADGLAGAAEELRAILQEVNEAWPPREPGATPLPYEELRALADLFPPPARWYEEQGDPF